VIEVRPILTTSAKKLTTSPTDTGCLKRKEFTATVVTRPRARCIAGIAPATSACAMIQPPKTSPCGLTSEGIGMTRSVGCLLGKVLTMSTMLTPQEIERSAGKRREAGTENDSGVGQVGVGNDPVIDQLLRAVEQRLDQARGQTRRH